ncbi:hypothetical protein [Mesorhizobium sp. ZC-5]|uniref:hypothetical protein n=1 Tax=Mesorhizobium sp. ZC-5 TaxID=2986066 RepID=UPI0021E81EEE|nr:hypothetical protein [Mesorhizobium sp. ZC-5]MCV3243287.1 hypothetical protein [Mesorhizobium sp. ZC-5]
MNSGTIDVQATRTFGVEQFVGRQWPVFAGFLALGLFVLWHALQDDNPDAEVIVLGLIAVVGSLVYLGRALRRRGSPGIPVLELSSRGILYRLGRTGEFRIPWTEVHSLRRVDITVSKGPDLHNVPAVLMSRQFFDANVPIKSWWARGPLWRDYFIPDGDWVQFAIHHDILSVTAEDLWNEIETRWRVFGGHADTAEPQTGKIPETRL